MTTPAQHGGRRLSIDNARATARRTTFTLARDAGAQAITRPAYPGAPVIVPDVEPLPGMRSARDLELGARQAARDYIRAAREAGHSWHDIGTTLDLHPASDPQHAGETIAEAAYTYATGHPGTETARRYGRTFTWACPTCDSLISDRDPCNGPADDEHGHASNCRRHAMTIAAWDAQWEAEP